MAAGLRATAKAVEHPPEPKVGAPVLDPTDGCGKLVPMFHESSGSTGSAQMSSQKSSRFITTAWIAIVGIFSSPSFANIGDVPSPFRRDVQCMMNVLQKTPRVDQVESGALPIAQ
jgi:hypothetical protein